MTTTYVLASLLVLFGAIALLAQALDLLLGREKKKRFERLIKSFHEHYSASDPKDAMYLPIFIIGAVYDRIFGKRIVSGTAFYRSFWLTTGFLIVTLAITGFMIKTPFGVKTAPWEFSEASGKIAQQTIQKLGDDPKFTKQQLQASILVTIYTGLGEFLNSSAGKLIYTLCFFLAVIVPNALLNFSTVVINRLFLKEILESKSAKKAILVMLYINFFFMAFASSLILLFLGVFAVPAIWPGVIPLFIAAIRTPSLFMILLEIAINAAWHLCSIWLKVSACITLIPTTLILFSVLIGYVGRRYVKAICVFLVDRGMQHEKGFLAYIAIGIGIITAAIGLLIKAL